MCNGFRDAENYHFDKLDTQTSSKLCSRSFVVIVTCYNKNIDLSRVSLFFHVEFTTVIITLRMGHLVSFSAAKVHYCSNRCESSFCQFYGCGIMIMCAKPKNMKLYEQKSIAVEQILGYVEYICNIFSLDLLKYPLSSSSTFTSHWVSSFIFPKKGKYRNVCV